MILAYFVSCNNSLIANSGIVLDLKDTSFGNNLKLLGELPHFRDLVAPIDVRIRNAYAHPSVLRNDSTETITFNDKRDSVTLTFSEFVQQTRELTAVLVICSNIDSLMLYSKTLELREYLS